MITTSNMTQWDLNRTVEIDSPAQVHFALVGSDECLTVQPEGTTVNVPNILLQDGGDILCWTYKDNQTIDKARISVSRKPKPTDYIYTETEVLSFGKINDRIDDLSKKIENIEVGSFTLPIASSSTLGGIKVGRNLTISDDGTLDAPFAVKGDKGDKGEPGTPGSDAAATDVRIAGKSITADGVADIPLAATNSPGVIGVKTDGQYGIAIGTGNNLFVRYATNTDINLRLSEYKGCHTKAIGLCRQSRHVRRQGRGVDGCGAGCGEEAHGNRLGDRCEVGSD